MAHYPPGNFGEPLRHDIRITWQALTLHYPELLILVLAALTRFWRLDYHSFWFDEAVSLNWAGSDPAYTWDVTLQLVQDKHPPVYYILLHYWQQGLGWLGLAHNDAALRALGSLLGVLMVWGLLRLATALSGRQVGLLAGALAAVAPVLVWYSQELRMFQPATTAIVWAAYCLHRAGRSPTWPRRWLWWLGLVATLTAALYSYLFSAFVLPAIALLLLAPLLGFWRHRSPVTCHPSRCHPSPVTFPSAHLHRRRPCPRPHNPVLSPAGAQCLGCQCRGRHTRSGLRWLRRQPDAPVADLHGLACRLAPAVAHRRPGSLWLARAGWAGAPVAQTGIASSEFKPTLAPAPYPAADRLWLWAWLGAPLVVGNLLLARNDSIFAEDRYFLFLGPFVLWAVARGAWG